MTLQFKSSVCVKITYKGIDYTMAMGIAGLFLILPSSRYKEHQFKYFEFVDFTDIKFWCHWKVLNTKVWIM